MKLEIKVYGFHDNVNGNYDELKEIMG